MRHDGHAKHRQKMIEPLFDESLKPPGHAAWLMEWRAVLELGAGLAAAPALARLPRGDGHPVMVLPGFLTSDLSTALLRRLLGAWGYRVEKWSLGPNLTFNQAIVDRIGDRAHALSREQGRKVSLIGWSLGGLLAREVARRNAEDVRQLVTLSSPFARNFKASNLGGLYEFINGETVAHMGVDLIGRLSRPVAVPSTAIYTRSDGIVAWQTCMEQQEGPWAENVAVRGSHCGLVYNPQALRVVADRLSQPEGKWRRIDDTSTNG